MAVRTSENNIRIYKKPFNFNIGMLLFGLVFVYIIVVIVLYVQSSPIVGYQVKSGSLSSNNVFTAIALREEKLFYAASSGYVNFYAREGEKVAAGNLVYTVDESGKLSEYLSAGEYGENELTDDELSSIRTDVTGFSASFDPLRFETLYDFKNNMETDVQRLANSSVMDGINSLNQSGNGDLINFYYAESPGIVVYGIDEYENLTPAQGTEKDFDRDAYVRKQLLGNDLVATGDPVYKECVNEDWSIVIQVDEEKAAELEEAGYVRVRFLKNQDEITGKVAVFRQDAEHIFAQLSFTNSMLIFCKDRFLDVELILEEEKGLKIPNSSIVNKEFYLVPKEYVIDGGDGYQVLRTAYMEDGTTSQEVAKVSVHNYDEETGEYYIDDTNLRIGDILLKTDSADTFVVSKRGTLIGVYNINKGYADFKQIHILYQNDEYAIVQSGTHYGLSEYDFIVLEADTVNEDDFVYE